MDANLSQNVSQRTEPTPQELETLVEGQITAFVSDESSFTAFSVTQALRDEHPDIEVSHADVRPLVRAIMSGSTDYTTELASFPTGRAVQYVPVDEDEDDDQTVTGIVVVSGTVMAPGLGALLPGIAPVAALGSPAQADPGTTTDED